VRSGSFSTDARDRILSFAATEMHRRDALGRISASAVAIATANAIPVRYASAQTSDAPAKSPTITTRKIPSSGEAIPMVGLGTWQTFDVAASETVSLEAVLRELAALGGSVLDSSPMYGRSEDVAGQLIEKLKLREKLFVATKVWTSGKAAGIAQMEDSMRKLRAKPLELMQVHNLLDVETHLDTLRAWKAEKRVKYIGVTHYTASAYDAVAKAIAKHNVDFLQINYSVAEREAERRLLPLARERGIAVIINRPFAGGGLLRQLREKPLPALAKEIQCESWAQLLMKYVLSHPAVTCAIPATSKVEHLRDNMAAGMGAMPDEKLRAEIGRVAAG
jgi:diketogulonate reductase-like aldo/keto reductase